MKAIIFIGVFILFLVTVSFAGMLPPSNGSTVASHNLVDMPSEPCGGTTPYLVGNGTTYYCAESPVREIIPCPAGQASDGGTDANGHATGCFTPAGDLDFDGGTW